MHIQAGRYYTSSSKRTKSCRLFLLKSKEKRDFRSVLINQAVIMAPMPSCRLEGSRHPVTQRPGPRGQSPSQNSTPGRTPRANCPSQCQPFQCPHSPSPPSTFSFIPLFLLPFPPLLPSSQLCDPLSLYATEESTMYTSMYQRGGENEK